MAGLSAPSVPLPRPAHDAPLGVGMHLFSGPSGVAQGLAAESRARGFEVLEIDLEGDPAYDLLDDVVYHALLAAARRGEYQWIVAGIPCNTYSVSLWREDAWSEARPLRGRGTDAEGLPNLGADERRKVAEANLLAHRACWLCREVQLLPGTASRFAAALIAAGRGQRPVNHQINCARCRKIRQNAEQYTKIKTCLMQK